MEIQGTFTTAKVFAANIEEEAIGQIRKLCDQPFAKGAKIRVMPDVHAGKGCTIGTTITISDKVVPNLVGVDIGCGMETIMLAQKDIDLKKLDEVINEFIPSGRHTHKGRVVHFEKLQELNCYRELRDTKRIERSIGTLGGGNHFIEANRDEEGNIYLVVHSGSRNLGTQVAEHYQRLAYDLLRGKDELFAECERIIIEYKEQGRKSEIQSEIKRLKAEFEASECDVPKDLAYLTGKYFDMYIADMKICQEYAELNRKIMLAIICEKMGFEIAEQFTTTHNYIDTEKMMLRKGAVSAEKGEKLLIPINMRDGSLICIGKGNEDYNCSAPHGAGRLMSRTAARARLNLEDFKQSMEGIYSTSISEATLDECPAAYKPMQDIIDNITDTAEIIKIIKPIYNFKAGE